MISKEIEVRNPEGLHARPATFFIHKANTFKSSVWVENGDRRANAKSLLGVLSLGIGKETKITIRDMLQISRKAEASKDYEILRKTNSR